jgi:hypothetical protein
MSKWKAEVPMSANKNQSDEVEAALTRLLRLEKDWVASLPDHPLPEFNANFDLGDRKDDRIRTVKYLQQSCSSHIEHCRAANAIKIAYLLSGYRSMAEARNIYGLYYFTRGGLELLALFYELKSRFAEIVAKPNDDFITKGQEFFSLIVRARYATSNAKLRSALKGAGLSERSLKPLNVMSCLQSLAAAKEFSELAAHYDELCDFVHHNAASHAAGSTGLVEGSGFIHSSGGGMITPTNGHWSIYRYPVLTKEDDAIEKTAPLFVQIIEATGQLLGSLPRGPFDDEFLIKETGNRFAMQIVRNPQGAAFTLENLTNGYKPRYNDLCPCGSAKKFKQCCLHKRHIGES